MTRILIGVLSCQAYSERRQRCLRSWIHEALDAGIDVVFLLGGSKTAAKREGLNLLLPCPDDYDSLPMKVGLFLEWASKHAEFEYIFKCDDDTYLRPDRLLAFDCQGKDYIGAEWSPGVEYASGGAGYWVSRKSVAVLAPVLRRYTTGAEDVLVGQILANAGIHLKKTDRFIPFGNEQLRPQSGNAIITSHACDEPWKAHEAEFCGARPVVTCVLAGRLGNKMFQAAAALGFAARTAAHDAVFLPGAFGKYSETMFRNLKYSKLPEELLKIGDPPDFTFNAAMPNARNMSVQLAGYMQSERYFAHCRDLIRRMFAIPGHIKSELYGRFSSLLQPGCVSLHVRRGDFLDKPEYHPVLPMAYYLNAIRFLDERVEVRKLYCFSDDPDWCQKNLVPMDPRITVVEQFDDYLDLALMSLCRHHVTANSSFSWWGAWLGIHPDKIVISPDVYLGPGFIGYSDRDLRPESWIRISGNDESVSDREIHPHGFWLTRNLDEHHAFDQRLCEELTRFFLQSGGTVADLGCGPGKYTEAFNSAGIHCDGYDGNPLTSEFTGGRCRQLDLSRETSPETVYDWVLSLEVGEHIPERFESSFISNLDHHNRSGIVLSWAVPGQGGHGHFNERSNSHVRDCIERLGYYSDPALEARFRRSVSNCSWFRNTIMVFRRQPPHFPNGITPYQIRQLVGRPDPVFLELGCNDGSDSQRFLDEFEEVTLHCFEPDPRAAGRFKVRDHRCKLHQIAIGEHDGELPLYQSGGTPPDNRMEDWDLSSSIRRPTGHLAAHPWCSFDSIATVSVRSLDSWFGEHPNLTRVDFVWADIQGAEGDLIRGGRDTLKRYTRFLYTECYETQMYEGQPARREILDMLPEFECIGMYEGYNMLLRNRLIYRPEHQIDRMVAQ